MKAAGIISPAYRQRCGKNQKRLPVRAAVEAKEVYIQRETWRVSDSRCHCYAHSKLHFVPEHIISATEQHSAARPRRSHLCLGTFKTLPPITAVGAVQHCVDVLVFFYGFDTLSMYRCPATFRERMRREAFSRNSEELDWPTSVTSAGSGGVAMRREQYMTLTGFVVPSSRR